MTNRKCKNWLKTLATYVEETESPRIFWLWSGIFTIASALQRKTWISFGLENLYPNFYVMIVAEPGECRKGAPTSLAKKFLIDIESPVFADSPTKRAMTKAMHKLSRIHTFRYKGDILTQCPIALISKEMSSFLAVDPKSMIEVLTDLFDSHDEWKYETSGEGKDILYGVCVGCLFASTPSWIAANLPEEAIGGGFTSRFVVVHAKTKYKWLSLPPTPDTSIYKDLLHDLNKIRNLIGEFTWEEGALETYDKWYNTIETKTNELTDKRLRGYFSRIHIMVLKLSMVLQVAQSDELLITSDNILAAITILEEALATASDAFGAHGRSTTSVAVHDILRQLRQMGSTTFAQLLTINVKDTNRKELTEIIETVEAMGVIKVTRVHRNELTQIDKILWIGAIEKGSGGKARIKKDTTPNH